LDEGDTSDSVCHNQGVSPVPVHLGAKGRVVLPASIRRQLGLEQGAELLARVEGEGIVLEPRGAALRRLRSFFDGVPSGTSLVDDVLAERRRDAAHDA
jgi:AbrB family looped-hinge helix DNA binding protein